MSYTIDRFAGLYNGPNELSAAPKGALRSAKNCVIRNRGVIEPRRGQAVLSAFEDTLDIRELFYYSDQWTCVALNNATGHFQVRAPSVTYLPVNDPADPTNASKYAYPTPPASTTLRTKGQAYKGRLYLTTDSGVQVVPDRFDGTRLERAGAPRGTGFRYLTVTAFGSSSPVLGAGKSFAYVTVWGLKDANGRVILGAPSGREIVTNTLGSASNVIYQAQVPYGVGTQHFCRIYRTEAVTSPTPPGAEYYLVDEVSGITSAEIAQGYLNGRVDDTPDAALQDVAYFSDTQGGLLGANDTPPLCLDMCLFGDRALYANTRQRHSLTVTLLGVDPAATGSGGVLLGDTFNVYDQNGTALITLTAATVQDLANSKFYLSTNANPSLAIEETCQSIVRVINAQAGSPVAAYYTPNQIGFGGNITLFLETLTASSSAYFYLTAPARGDAYNPPLPTSGTSVKSSDDYAKNRVYWSRIGQPDAVPLVNYVDVGSSERAILRVMPLRDKVYVFKEDGIFTLSGAAPYRVDELDATVVLMAPDSVATASNQIYALTNQGVVAVSEGGAQIVSGQIENAIAPFTAAASAYHFGAALEAEHLYLLFLRSGSATVAYVYHTGEGLWTTWEMTRQTAKVDPTTGRLVSAGLRDALTGHVLYLERKSYTRSDYVDDVISAGLVVSQAYPCEVLLAASALGDASAQKQSPAVTFHFRKAAFAAAEAVFSTDLTPAEKIQTLTFSHAPNGPDANGASPVLASLPVNKRVLTPGPHQRASYYVVGFRIEELEAAWALNGLTFEITSGTEKNSR